MSREARRPVLRWGVRLFMRDWRQQALILALLVFAVAAALFGSVASYAAVPSRQAEFGTAARIIGFRVVNPALVAEDVASFRADVGDLEVINHRRVAIPGAVTDLDFRDQAPGGRFSAPMLTVLAGRYPTAPNEIALTDGAARDFRTRLGARLVFDRAERSVVGIVENPANFDDEFALAPPGAVTPEFVRLFVGQDRPVRPGPLRSGPGFGVLGRGQDENAVAAAIVLLMATVLLALVGLVAAAGFAVVAHRRQRQLGMLAAVGATDRQLRAVMLSNGVIAGAVAATVGSAIAGVVWFGFNGPLGRAFGHRIDAANVPWWIPASNAVLAVVAATTAAWWPARRLARVPITDALSGRPPTPAASRRPALLAALLLGGGLLALSRGVNTKTGDATPWLLIPGALATIAGVLVLSPLAIRALAHLARRTPLPLRLALRELDRHRSRSGAALAAIALGLGLAVTTVIVSAAAADSPEEGALSDRQLLIRSESEILSAEQVRAARPVVDDLAKALGKDSRTFELSGAIARTPEPGLAKDGPGGAPMALARQVGAHTWRFVSEMYVATPELLTRLGVDPRPDADVVTAARGQRLQWLSFGRRLPDATIQRYAGSRHYGTPMTLITAHGLAKAEAVVEPRGWFVEADHALSPEEVAAARDAAATLRLEVQSRDDQDALATARTVATGVGVLVALCLLGMTIGLIRSEAGRDLQTLVATGATSFTRRALSAATSGSLALLGAALGVGGAYAALAAIYLDELSALTAVPVAELAVVSFGLPLAAAAAGFVLTGREPAVITRKALD